jgi:hypothetical protein
MVDSMKKFGPYTLKGSNEESTWEGHKITGKHWGTPIGSLKIDNTYSNDWSCIEGTLKPKLPGIKGKYFMKRIKVSDEEVVYEGYSKMMGFKTPLRMVVTREKIINTGIGEAKDIEEAKSELVIEPLISDEDWREFKG